MLPDIIKMMDDNIPVKEISSKLNISPASIKYQTDTKFRMRMRRMANARNSNPPSPPPKIVQEKMSDVPKKKPGRPKKVPDASLDTNRITAEELENLKKLTYNGVLPEAAGYIVELAKKYHCNQNDIMIDGSIKRMVTTRNIIRNIPCPSTNSIATNTPMILDTKVTVVSNEEKTDKKVASPSHLPTITDVISPIFIGISRLFRKAKGS
jgi:hypothetical protein